MADVRSFPKVPILGQPVTVSGWPLIVYAECKACVPSTFVPLMVKQNALGRTSDLTICPGCGRAMHLEQLQMDEQGQFRFGIAMGEQVAQPATTAN